MPDHRAWSSGDGGSVGAFLQTPVRSVRSSQCRLAVAHIHPYTCWPPCWSRLSVKPPVEIPPSRQIRPFDLQRERPPGPRSVFSPPPGDKTRPGSTSGTKSSARTSMPGCRKIWAARRHPARPDQLLSLLADWRPSEGSQDEIKALLRGQWPGFVPTGLSEAGGDSVGN